MAGCTGTGERVRGAGSTLGIIEAGSSLGVGLLLDDEVLDSEELFLPGFGLTHPSVLATPSGVTVRLDELFDLDDDPFLLDFLFLLCLSPVEGARTNELCDIRFDSCSNVLIASIREELERFIRA